MTKVGNFINKDREKLVQLLPYQAVVNPETRKTLAEEIITARNAEGSGVPALPFLTDAPIDGKQYARKDGAWAEVQGGGSEDWELLIDNTTTEEVANVFHSFAREYREFLIVGYNLQSAGTTAGAQIFFEFENLVAGTKGINSLATPIQPKTTPYKTRFLAKIENELDYITGSLSIVNTASNAAGSQNLTFVSKTSSSITMDKMSIHLGNANVNKLAVGFNYKIYGKK